MATSSRSMLNATVGIDATGKCYSLPYDECAGVTNDLVLARVFVFGAADINGIHGSFRIPDNYASAAVFRMHWTCDSASNGVRWEWYTKAVADGEDMDPSSRTTTPSSASRIVVPGTTHYLSQDDFTCQETISANEMLQWQFVRYGTDGTNDDCTGKTYLFELEFRYTTT